MALPLNYQTAPRLYGNHFDFDPQTALNVLLPERFPAGWTIPPNRPFIMGFGWPFTASAGDAAKRFTNAGFNYAERPDFVNTFNVPASKRYLLARDADLGEPIRAAGQADQPGGEAGRWAATLPDSDPRKAHLRAYGLTRAVTSSDYSLYRELGRRTYYAVKGIGLGLVGLDIESFADNTPVSVQQAFSDAANLGFGDAITQDNPNCKIFNYGGSLAPNITYTDNRQNDDKYMREPGNNWKGVNSRLDINASALVQYYRSQGAFLGRDQYARRTWDDRSLFQKNGDGSIKFDAGTGRPLFVVSPTGTLAVTNFGVQAFTTGYESRNWLEMWYEEFEKIYCDWSYLCNTNVITYTGKFGTDGVPMPYPKGTVDIRPGLEKIKLNSFYRDDTESEGQYNPFTGQSEEAPNSNRRPLNPRAIRFQVFLRTLLYHGNIMWSDKSWMNYETGKTFLQEGGGQYTAVPPLAMGQYECMLAGRYQAANFPMFFTLMDAGKLEFIIPKRAINHGNDAVGEREENKPMIWLMKEQVGLRVYGMACFPIADVGNTAHNLTITAWLELDNGTKSGSYLLGCRNRNVFFDGWVLGAGFEGAKPENWRFQFTSPITGLKFTWTGDLNVPFTGAHPTPPATVVRTVFPAGANQ